MGETQYKAFISYAHADERWASWLHRALETYRVPKKLVGAQTAHGAVPARLTPIFRDRDELSAADSLSAEIEAALERSRSLIVLCSPRAVASQWVGKEILRFKQLHGEGRVLAVIVDGEPNAADPAEECFPEALKFRIGPDGALSGERTEPIAADLRKGGDGKKAGLHKLIAGLLGVKLDELIEREAQRRAARLRVWTGGFGLVAAGMAALAVNAVLARDEARAQRAEAVAARDDAEDLIEFMLTDLRTRLDAVGRLDVLDSVGERALAYYDARDLAGAEPDALGRRARAQLLVGEIDNLRGDLDAALEAYEAAAATTAEQLRRNPDSEQQIFDHAQSVFWVGYIAWQRGDAEKARTQFTEYYELAQKLAAIDPENDDWQLELNYAYSNLGTLEIDAGNAEKAEEWFRQSLAVSKALYDKDPDDIERAIALGQDYAWLEDALRWQMRFEEALEVQRSEISLYDNALASDSQNARILRRKLTGHRGLGVIALYVNDLDNALIEAEIALALGERLVAADPENLYWKEHLALTQAQIGEIQFHAEVFPKSIAALETAIALGNELIAADDTYLSRRLDFEVMPRWLLSRIAFEIGDLTSANDQISDALDLSSEHVHNNPDDALAIRFHFRALVHATRIGAQDQNRWKEIISTLGSEMVRLEPNALVPLLWAYAETGAYEQAYPIVDRFSAAGFRHPDFLEVLEAHPMLMESRVE